MYADKQEQFLSVVKLCKLAWYGHVNGLDSLPKTILQGEVKGSGKIDGQKQLGLIT
jgi:hypothetical protein